MPWRLVDLCLVILAIGLAFSHFIVQVALAALLIARAHARLRHGTALVEPTPLDVPAALYAAAAAISLVASPEPIDSWSTSTNLWSAASVWLLFPVLRDPARLHLAFHATLVAFVAAALYGTAQHLTGVDVLRVGGHFALVPAPGLPGRYMAVGNFTHHIAFAVALLPPLAIALAFAAAAPRAVARRISYATAVAVLGTGVLASLARTAWMALAVGLVALVLAGRRLRRAVALTAVAGVVAALLVVPGALGRLRSTSPDLDGTGRAILWRHTLTIIGEHPLVGVGFGNFRIVARRTFDAAGHTWHPVYAHAHNEVLNTWAETGALGVVPFVALWVAFFVVAVRALRRAGDDPARHAVLAGGTAGVLMVLVAGLADCPLRNHNLQWSVWFFTAATLAAARPRDPAA